MFTVAQMKKSSLANKWRRILYQFELDIEFIDKLIYESRLCAPLTRFAY